MAIHCRLQLQINDDKLAAISHGEMFYYDTAMGPLVNRISLSFARKNADK